jgi:hypothetical protein
MRIGQRIMDAKTKTICRVARIEEDLIILTAEDESGELGLCRRTPEKFCKVWTLFFEN